MSARGKGLAVVTKYFRSLRGGSQPILAEASDGLIYVVKFGNNPQGPNLLFNESAGTEVYQACGLSVPSWRPLFVGDSFIDSNPDCWFHTAEGRQRPESGLCFGSRFLGGDGAGLWEVLPGSRFKQVSNRFSFWQAWLIDICAEHADSRQAIFLKDGKGGFETVFIDHGHLFGGPKGEQRQNILASRYLDPRLYEYRDLLPQYRRDLLRPLGSIDLGRLRRRIQMVTGDWKTASSLEATERFLDRLSDTKLLHNVVDEMVSVCPGDIGPGKRKAYVERNSPILRFGVQTAQVGSRLIRGTSSCAACP